MDGWNAGYRWVLVPSDWIDAGKIVGDGHGGVLYGGRRFSAMVYFGPEYSTTASLKFLESFVATGGKLRLDGVATRDFAPGTSKDVSGRSQQKLWERRLRWMLCKSWMSQRWRWKVVRAMRTVQWC